MSSPPNRASRKSGRRHRKRNNNIEHSPPPDGPSPIGANIDQADRVEAVNRWNSLPGQIDQDDKERTRLARLARKAEEVVAGIEQSGIPNYTIEEQFKKYEVLDDGRKIQRTLIGKTSQQIDGVVTSDPEASDSSGNLHTPALPQRPNPTVKYSLLFVFSPHWGVMLLLLTEFIAAVMAMMTRYLETREDARTLHPLNIISWRMPAAFVGCLMLGWWKKTPDFPLGRKGLRTLLCLRGLGGFLGVVGFYYALTALPLPDATVISFLVPTLVGIACSLIPDIGEPFTTIEMISGVTSFIGVLLIARPTFLFSQNPAGNLFDPSVSARVRAVVSALLGICGSSIAYTTLRWLKDGTDPLIPVTYFTGFGTVGSIICLATLPSMPGFLLPATALEWMMAFALSFGGFVMQWTLTRGMQLTKGSIGAQIIAAQLVFAVVLELMVWGDLPTAYSCVGILLIVFSLTVVNIFKAKDSENSRRAGDDCVPEEQRGLLQAEEGL